MSGRRVGPHDGADVLSDFFLAAFQSRQRYDTKVPAALPWLYGIASNLLSKHFRKRVGELRALQRVAGQTQLDGSDDAVAASVDAQLEVRRLAKTLEELPSGERNVLLLHAWEGLTYQEVARALDIPAGTVRSRLNRTRRKLQVRVDEVDLVRAARPDRLSPALVADLRTLTVSAFEVIESAWKEHGGVYVDFKIECGFDRETGELLVADVIDSDSGRLRFGEVDMSKQSYRDGTATLPEIKKKFDEVATLTDIFA